MAYTTNTALKTYLGIPEGQTSHDSLLTTLIARAQAAIDAYTGRTFEASANTSRTFDAVHDVDNRVLYLDRDLCSINSITNGDGTTVTSSEYVTEPRNDTPYFAIRLRSDASISWTYDDYPENAITISGKWAYSVSAPDDIVQACTRLAGYYYKQRDAQVFDVTADPAIGTITIPQGFPADVERLLRRYVVRI